MLTTTHWEARVLFNMKVRLALLAVMAILVFSTLFWSKLERALWVATLFSGQEQYDAFPRLTDFFPHSTMTASEAPYVFPEAKSISIPGSFSFKGNDIKTSEFLSDTDSAALLILQDGNIVFEDYWGTGGSGVQWISMSLAKSFISAGVGIAADEGRIEIDMPVLHYLPQLQGSAYEGATVRQVLQMSSGARWSEDYSDSNSEIKRSTDILAYGGSIEEFIGSIPNDFEPGARFSYNSMDTQVLAMVLASATGESVTQYMERKLWQPMGMESNGRWLLDSDGAELAYFGLNAVARDYLKFGELFRLQGEWKGRQIISKEWIRESTTPLSESFAADPEAGRFTGYGYQWWIPPSREGEFSAIGIYHQFIYVNPQRKVVIVKLSADSNYAYMGASESKRSREEEHLALFNTIAREIDNG